ncbi:hypothetical protein DPMN_118256 [Dreissena polymorpha]|uniref:Uncharacterized protein n=1 Tax=Dreissena polymorpha TaxID=45954 RepID=A0A9D4GKF4_DREPO|nr:hypothetical protein DPMN_118256 [Dreissena polymorpha]
MALINPDDDPETHNEKCIKGRIDNAKIISSSRYNYKRRKDRQVLNNNYGKFHGSGSFSMKSAKALPRYNSGHKSARRTEGRTEKRTDGRATPKQYPSAYGGG